MFWGARASGLLVPGASGAVAAVTTWNPSDKHADTTLSNGNLTATSSVGSFRGVRATTSKTSGSWFYEVTIVSLGVTTVGFANASAGLNDLIGSTNGVGLHSDGTIFRNGGNIGSADSYTAGDVIGMAINYTGNTLQFYKNGSAVGSSVGSVSGYGYPAVSIRDASVTGNFGPASPPGGFTVWG